MAVEKSPDYKFPKTMGACADRLYELRAKRLEVQKLAEQIEAEEKALKEYIIQNLPKSDTGAQGKHHRVSVVTKVVPRVEDWDAVYKYVKRTGSFDLFQRRLSDPAVIERWEAGKTVPGVTRFQLVTLSLTKI
jgi:hypothetical protein